MKHNIPFREIELAHLQEPECAREYLKISLEETRKDENREAFLRALRNVVDARGGIVELSKRMHKPTSTLYKAISEDGNPRLDTLDLILGDIGLQLSVDVVNNQHR
jgi:DNA-binding phage protein